MSKGFLIGEGVILRGFEKEDLKYLYNWLNNSEVTCYIFLGDRPAIMERLVENWEKEFKSPNDIAFAVVEKTDGKVVGSAGLYSINFISRSAEFRIIIGEPEYWDKGIGAEAAKLLVSYAFNKLNLNKVWLGVNADNIRAVKSYEKAGFVREGVLRQEIYRNGRHYDAVRMSVLREEFRT